MIKLADLLKEDEAPKCPVATQNIEVNLNHRQIAIDRYGYGPLNPNNPNIKFWREKAMNWKLDSIDEAKSARCNNCAAFNITTRILNCLEMGIAAGEKEVAPAAPQPQTQPAMEAIDDAQIQVPLDTKKPVKKEVPQTKPEAAPVEEPELDDTQGAEKDAWDTIEAGKMGYCTFHKFKCAGSRTCNAWVSGGPVKDK